MLNDLIQNIWAVLLDTAFWLLLGLFAAGMIKVFIPADAMKRWVGGRGFAAVTRAALFGAPLPLCSCGVLPAAIGLRRSGASKEATVSFLISTPETSIDSVAVTYALMGPVMAVYRPLAALVSAMLTGLMTAFVNDETPAIAESTGAADAVSCCSPVQVGSEKAGSNNAAADESCCATTQAAQSGTCCAPEAETATGSCCSAEAGTEPDPAPVPKWLQSLKYAGAELLDDIAAWMAVGIIVAGVMLTFVPPGWLAQWGHGLTAMLVMLLVGIPMYICAVASTPIAAGLLLAGVSPGAVLVFLLVGPATNIASFALVRRELGNRVTLVYFTGISVVSVGMGLLLEALLLATGWHIDASIGEAHAMLPSWLVWSSALLLVVLAIKPLRRALLPVLG